MEILINGQPLDFTLENGETLGEIVDSVQRWLDGAGMIISSALLGGEEILGRPREQWAALGSDRVERLELTARDARSLKATNLETVVEYLRLLRRAIDSGNQTLLGELIQGLPLLGDSLRSQFPGARLPQLAGLDSLLSGADPSAVLSWKDWRREEVLQQAEQLEALASARLREVDDPAAALREVSGALGACIQEIGEVSVLLQTGHDRQAMAAVIRFTDLSQTLTRLFGNLRALLPPEKRQLAVGSRSAEEFYQELNGSLRQLLEAFEGQDSVLIGDLLEYEIAPRLDALRGVVEELAR